MKDRFTFHKKWALAIEALPSEHDRLMMYHAVIKYCLTGNVMDMSDNQRAIFDCLNIRRPRNEGRKSGIIASTDDIEIRKEAFRRNVSAYIPQYGAEMLEDFYLYWSESDGRRMRWEMQRIFEMSKRLATWNRKSKNYGKRNNNRLDELKRAAQSVLEE